MSDGVWFGIFCIGTVFGYLLFYSVKHTKEFNVDLLVTAIGAAGGGAVIKFVGGTEGWLGPYGTGIGLGFLIYGVLSFLLIGTGSIFVAANDKPGKWKALSQALLGKPRE